MMMKTGRTTPLHRVLAILLSLLMLLQSTSVFAEDITTPEAIPEAVQEVITEPASDDVEAPEGNNALAETIAAPNEDGKTPAEETGTINGTPETPDEAGGETGEPGETANGEENTGIPEETAAAPAAEPVIDTSESITMTEAGYVPAPPYFEGTLVYEGPDYTITAVIGTDAMFPEDVQMRVSEILPGTEQYELYNQMMEETLEEGEELGEFARYFDISFITVVDGVETEIEPQAEIDVQITFQETIALTEESDVQAIHIAENTPEILETVTDSLEAAVNDDEAIDTVTFSADSFSIYGVVQKIKKILKVITASGATFTVDVTYTSDANIPEDAELIATEITPNDPNYNIYREQTALALGADDVKLPGLFDLGIYVNGEKIQPEAPVSVAISLNEGIQEGEKLYVVHFPEGIEAAKEPEPAEAEPKLMAAPRMMRAAAPMNQSAEQQSTEQQTTEKQDTEATEPETKNETPAVATEVVSEVAVEGETVTFAANGFSVYALAYTVDFHWEVDGQEYEFSLTGGDSISFRNLVEALQILEQNEAENYSDTIDRFIANIADIQFSDPALLWVGKTEKETTALEIAAENDLQIEYSAELLDQQITLMQGKAYPAEEWVLMSLKPFTSEEYLTVTMKNEETFIILVTDAQLKKTVIDAKGDTWEITVTYGPDAQIPDEAELVVNEITEGMPGYAPLFEAMENTLSEEENDKEHSTVPVLFDISIVANGEEVEPAPNSTVVVEARLVRSSLGSIYSENAPVQINDVPLTEENSSVEAQMRVIHVKNDGTSELVNTEDELSITEVTSAFVTDSFSDWLMYLDETLTDITVGVDDTITLRPYSSWIWTHADEHELGEYENVEWVFPEATWSHSTINGENNTTIHLYELRNYSDVPNAKVQYMVYEKYDSQLEETYTVAYGYANYPGEYDIERTNGESIHVTVTGDVPDVPPVVTGSANISVNLFNYDNTDDHVLDVQGNTAASNNNQNVNNGHNLKFLGWGGNNDNQRWINNYTHANPNQGIVQSTLYNGYPQLQGFGNQSLSYLFTAGSDPDSVRAYTNVQGLFQKDSHGYYYYNSNINYAWFDEASNRFVLYEHTFSQNTEGTNSQTGSSNNAKPIGFFPFHRYDAPVRDATHSGMNFNSLLDHHFGMSMQVEFTIPENRKTNEDKDIIYEFSGDDDLWVYVDGQLVLDIGGIHQPVRGTINFTTGIVTVHGAADLQFDINDPDGPFSKNKKHTLQMFYLERGGCDSNLSVKFNLPLTLGDLTFTKVDVNREGIPLKGAVFGLYSDEECTNLVATATSSDAQGNYGVVSFVDVPLGNTGIYYMKEITSPNGYELSTEVFEVHLKDKTGSDPEAIIYQWDEKNNTWVKMTDRMIPNTPKLTSLTVNKNWVGDNSGLSSDAKIVVTIKRYKLLAESQGVDPLEQQRGVLVIGQALADNGAAEHPEYFKVDYTIKKGGETVREGNYEGREGATITDLEPGNDYSIECVCYSSNSEYYVGNEQQNRTGITIKALDTTTVAFSNTLTKKEPKYYHVRVMSKDSENADDGDGNWPFGDYLEGTRLLLTWTCRKQDYEVQGGFRRYCQYNDGSNWTDIPWDNEGKWQYEIGPLTKDVTIKLRCTQRSSNNQEWNSYFDWLNAPTLQVLRTVSTNSAKMLAAPPSRAIRVSASQVPSDSDDTIETETDDVKDWVRTVELTSSTSWSATVEELEKVDLDNNIYVYYIASVEEENMPGGTIVDIDLADDGKMQVVLGDQDSPGTLSFTNTLLGELNITKVLNKNGQPDTSATGTYFYAVYSAPYNADSPQDPVRTGSIPVTSGGTATVTVAPKLPFGSYYVYELTGPGPNGTPITGNSAVFGDAENKVYYDVSVTGSPVTVSDESATVTIANNYNTTSVSVEKVWEKADGTHWENEDGTNGAPANGTVTFDLYRNGDKVSSIVLPITVPDGDEETNPWVATWNDLLAVNPTPGDDYGKPYSYTVQEAAGGWKDYVVTYGDGTKTSAGSGETITNKQQPVTAAPKATKVFTDLTKVSAEHPDVDTAADQGKWPGEGFTFTLAGPYSDDYLTAHTDASTVDMPTDNTVNVKYADTEKTKEFEEITFNKVGEYYFTVTETIPANPVPGVVYDTDPHHVVITVTEDPDGILRAIVSYLEDSDENGAIVTNKYTEILDAPEAQKTLTGRDWLADETFTFELTPDGKATNQAITDGKVVMDPSAGPWTAVAANTEKVSFNNITFKEAGEYVFRIKEIEPAETSEGGSQDPGESNPETDTTESTNSNGTLTYSKKQVLATATVTKDTQTGEMSISWTYLDVMDDNGGDVEVASNIAAFTNTYTTFVTAQIKGTKQVIDPVNPEDLSGYTFTLAGAEGAPVPTDATGTKATSGTDGSFQFAEITYPLSLMDDVTAKDGIKTKDYTYTVTEKLPEGITATDAEKLAGYKIVNGIRYDLTEKTVTVTLTYNMATGVMEAVVVPEQAGVLFTNTILGSVQATKTFVFPADSNLTAPTEFKITASWSRIIEGVETPYSVELKPSSAAQTITGTDYTVSAAAASGTTENPSYTWTIGNLPVGTEVTFTESGYEISGYNLTSTVSVNGSTATTGISGTTSAAVTPGTVAMTNTYVAGTVLPSTGGTGTLSYILSGLFFIAMAGTILLLRKRRA